MVCDLTKKLIQIPSYSHEKGAEEKLAIFIENFLNENCPWFSLSRHYISKNRYNLIASSQKNNPKKDSLIFCCHMDTVVPSPTQINKRGEIIIEEDENNISGLGHRRYNT